MVSTVLFHTWLILVPIRKGSVVLKQQWEVVGNMLGYLLTELGKLTPASEGPDWPWATKVGDSLGYFGQRWCRMTQQSLFDRSHSEARQTLGLVTPLVISEGMASLFMEEFSWLSCQTLLGEELSLRGSWDEICLLTDEPVLCACGTLVKRQGQNNCRLLCLSQFSPLNWSFAYWNERLWNSDTTPTPRLSCSVCVQPTHSLYNCLQQQSWLFQQWSLKPITHLLCEAHATRVKSLCALASQHPVCAATSHESFVLWTISCSLSDKQRWRRLSRW